MSDGGSGPRPPARRWLGRVSAYLASFAIGAAINDFSSTIGYHGLAGAVALLAVVIAATSIRGLDPRAPLSRGAKWLFLAPAACIAIAAAFTSGTTTNMLTGSAGILTIGAVIIANELESASKLLTGAAAFAVGVALIATGTETVADNNLLYWVVGATGVVIGAVVIADRQMLFGPVLILGGAEGITLGIVFLSGINPLHGKSFFRFVPESFSRGSLGGLTIAVGLAFIAAGIALMAGARMLNRQRSPGSRLALIFAGIVGVMQGYAVIYSTGTLLGSMLITVGTVIAAVGAHFMARTDEPEHRVKVLGFASFLIAVMSISAGIHVIAGDQILLGAALVAAGTASLGTGAAATGPRWIRTRIGEAVEWATKPPEARKVSELQQHRSNQVAEEWQRTEYSRKSTKKSS